MTQMPTEDVQKLDGLSSAYRTDAESGRRVHFYSRLVAWLKIGLPLAALAGIGVFYVSTRHSADLEAIFTAEELATLAAGMKLQSPSFTGVTKNGETFSIRADWAVPDSAVPKFVDLENPEGEIEMQGRGLVKVTAESGRLHREDKLLVLNGNVVLKTEDGYDLLTDQLEFTMGTQQTYAPGPVSGSGPNGQIEAGAMRLIPGDPEKGTRTQIWFENRVRLVLSPADAG